MPMPMAQQPRLQMRPNPPGISDPPASTVYRYSENRCEYVDEITAKEPVALPRGHLNQNQNQNFNENINSTTTDQTPKQ